MRQFLIAAAMLLAACPFFGQAAHRQGQVLQRGTGTTAQVVPFAQVQVCTAGTGGGICSTPSIYSDYSLTTPITGPITADSQGNYDYYLAGGCVDEVISSPGTYPRVLPYVCLAPSAAGTGVSSFSSGSLSPLFTTSVSNPTTTPSQSFALATTSNSTLFGNFSGATATPSWWTLAAGSNVTLTPSGSTLTISATSGGGTPGGANTQVQYNCSGAFCGSSGFTFNSSTNALTLGGPFTGTNLYTQGTDPVFGSVNSGAYTASALNHTEDRNASVLFAGGAHGAAIPQTQGIQFDDTFKGLGHQWRGSMQSEGATTQIGRDYTYYSGTAGQSIFEGGFEYFFGNGDQISKEDSQYCAGNGGQENAENCHSFWHSIRSGANAGPGTCLGGCGNAEQASIIWGGSVGQGSILYDVTDVQTATIVSGASGTTGLPWSSVALSGISLTPSKLFQIPQAIQIDQNVTAGSAASSPWQPTSVTVAISTSPVYTGALTSTSTIPTDGMGCLANPPTSSGLSNEGDSLEEYEPVFYHVVDATHLTLWTTLIHSTNTLFAVGGACGMGLEQKAQTDAQNATTVYPIIASIDATHVIYAGGNLSGAIVGTPGYRNFENGSCSVTNVSRSGTLATITTSGCSGVIGGLNGKSTTISGMTADAALNGTFTLTTNNVANQFTYTAGSGTIAPTSQSGTLKTGDTVGNLYPVALVLVPWNPAQPNTPDWYLTSPFTFPTVSAQVARSNPYYSQFNGDALTVSPNEDEFLGTTGYTINLAGGASRQMNPGGLGSPQIGLTIQNSGPVGQYQGHGGTYLPPDYAIKIQGLWQNGIYFDSSGAVGMLFQQNNTVPNATTWNYCAFVAADGASLCGSDVLAEGQSQLGFNVGTFQFHNTVGTNLAFEIDPEFNTSEGFIKAHSPMVIAPDHTHSSLWSLIVNPPSGYTEALQTTGYVQMTGLQTGLTCANFLGVDSTGKVGLFNPGCVGGGAVTSVSNSDGTMTFSPTTGAVVGSLNLAHANTWTAAQTAPAFIASGSGAGVFTLTAGTAPSTVASSVNVSAPSSISTPYNYFLPSGPFNSANPAIMQCTGTASSTSCVPATGSLSTALVTGIYSDLSFNNVHTNAGHLGIMGGSNTDNNLYYDVPTGGEHEFRINATTAVAIGNVSANYNGLTMNGSLSSTTMNGFLADQTGADPSMYILVASGGNLTVKAANVGVFTIQSSGSAPTGACSGNALIITPADGHGTWCNGTTYVSKF